MKKLKFIFAGLVVLAVATFAVINVGMNQSAKQTSELTLKDVEAMAQCPGGYEMNPWYLWPSQGLVQDEVPERQACPSSHTTSTSFNGGYSVEANAGDYGAGSSANVGYSHTETDNYNQERYRIVCPHGCENCTPTDC